VRKGEILGFCGLVGSGRSELARAIFGIDPVNGVVKICGESVVINHPSKAIARGIALVPEDRKMQGLHLGMSATYNLSLAVLDLFFRFIGYNKKKENALVVEYRNLLSIRMASPEQAVRYCSGGNQQKILLSKWLATNPKILILDEPTRGIDVGTKAEIYHLIYEIAASGVAVIMISSEMEEIINLSTRIAVMCEGQLRRIFDEDETKQITQEQIMVEASGGIDGGI